MAENNQKKASGNKPSAEKTKKTSHLWVWILIFIVWVIGNYTLNTNETSITSPKVSSKIRLAVISDQHATKHGIKNSKILEKITEASPDIVFILGDMYTRESDWELVQKPIDLTSDIVAAGSPVYCVTGEHDTDQRYISELKKAGAHVLSYEEDTV